MAREQRKLVAILFADVVGSSQLMGRDESGTVARLLEHLSRRLAPAAARCGGRVIRLTGDGGLVEFASAVDALRAAIEFQQAMIEANRGQPQEKAIVFRIGLHLGDVIVEGDDIYGDAVNVAARLEAEAPPGGIVASRAVRDAVQGRLKATLCPLGDLALKNIVRPIRAFRVDWSADDWPATDVVSGPASGAPAAPRVDAPLTLPDKPSIAVLPFQNMGGNPQQEYFADGMVDEIITALSRFQSLFVIARNSSFAYKGKSPDLGQVGRALGVRYVLEGSVRKAGSRVRIVAQLVQADTRAYIWAERYDGDLKEIFDLQDKVTIGVVSAIAPRVEQAEIERFRRKPTDNLDAYDCYLRAMACFHSRTLESFREAQQYCYRAIELDHNFSAPYAMAAYCHASFIAFGHKPSLKAVTKTSRFVRKALELDHGDALVLSMAAWAQIWVVRDLDSAAALLEQARALNPNLAMAWNNSGWVNIFSGRPDVGLEHIGHALRLSPSVLWSTERFVGIAVGHFLAGRFNEAMSYAVRALAGKESQIRILPACRIGAASAALAGHLEEARKIMHLLLEIDPKRRISNLPDVMGPYKRLEDIERFKEGLRLAGMPE